jgi:hypothetical protein
LRVGLDANRNGAMSGLAICGSELKSWLEEWPSETKFGLDEPAAELSSTVDELPRTIKFGLDEAIEGPSRTLEGFSAKTALEPDGAGGVGGSGGKEVSEVTFFTENEVSRGDGRHINSSDSDGRNLPWSESLSPRVCPLKAGDEMAVVGLLVVRVE